MIKLITFDLDDTLWPIHAVIKNASIEMQRWLDENYPAISQHYSSNQLFTLRTELIKQHPQLSGDLTQLRKKTLYQAAFHSGFSESQAFDISEQAFNVFFSERNKVTLFPHALTTLQTLNEKFSLIAISNGNADLSVIGIKDLFMEHFKAEAGKPAKPDPTMFHMALEFAEVNAEECVHVGDSFECDIQIAHQLGFKAVYVDILNQNHREAMKLADASINSLKELPNIIQSLNNKS